MSYDGSHLRDVPTWWLIIAPCMMASSAVVCYHTGLGVLGWIVLTFIFGLLVSFLQSRVK